MARIVINNIAARNNGDVALITALERALAERGHEVTFATPHQEHMRKYHSRLNVCPDVPGHVSRLFKWAPLRDLAAIFMLTFIRPIRQADLIIGAPGGYLNSYYGFAWKCSVYKWAKILGKKTAIHAQSVGPLGKSDSRRLYRYSRYLDVLVTRDALSERNARDAGVFASRLLPSVDAIFLREPTYSTASLTSNVVAISVRKWTYDGRSIERYLDLMTSLANSLLDRGYDVDFISTCQGIAGYIDDSATAHQIVQRLSNRHVDSRRVRVISRALSVKELTESIEGYQFVVGTRLHMCLLALMSGVPAFNISYEKKGIECFCQLDLADYSIDYNAEEQEGLARLAQFIENLPALRSRLPAIMQHQHVRACADLDKMLCRVFDNATTPAGNAPQHADC